jgi:hypothetical protein
LPNPAVQLPRRYGGAALKGSKTVAVLLPWTTLVVSVTSLGSVGEQRAVPIKQYAGQIRSTKIGQCGLHPLVEGRGPLP